MKQKHFWLIGTLMLAVCVGLASCGGDGDDSIIPTPGTEPETGVDNKTDVAVTGSVLDVGSRWADIEGFVNLNLITISYSSAQMGVEVSKQAGFTGSVHTQAASMTGRSFNVHVTGLTPSTTYYYRTYVSVQGLVYNGAVRTFTTLEYVPSSDPHDYVDLGLSDGTLWATMNVGASHPEDYGDYFAWGETKPKDQYDWNTYTWYEDGKVTKYNTSSSSDKVDGLKELLPEDDAAYVNWGPEWRMPSFDQISKLLDGCTWQWTEQNGVYGRKGTSKSNGNTIFLPAAGYRYDASLYSAGATGGYWSRTRSSDYPSYAFCLYFNSDRVNWVSYGRFLGLSVRPVRAQGL